MSFTFKWPRFSDDFHRDARDMLEAALNKGNKPPIIADKIEVVELEMGTQPPDLEIRDIGDLTLDQFRGIFRLSYSGDAHIVLRTKVQANPLNHKKPDIHMLGGSRGMLAAHQPLVVPMLLRLSHFVLNAYVVLVVSKQKGITLVFKTDPLQNVDVNSTFDSIAVIQQYIQREIEGQLREMFREDLPSIIHRLSQRWVAGKTKVEAPYLSKRPQQPRSFAEHQEVMASLDPMSGGHYHHHYHMAGLHPNLRQQTLSGKPSMQRMYAPSSRSAPSMANRTISTSPTIEPTTSFPEIENFDPTYGLRPDDLPVKSGYSGFGRLFGPPRGLIDLAEEPILDDGTEWNEADSFDMVDWDETASLTPPPSVASESTPEFETIPAVGGGTITRPRIYHSQASIHPPTDSDSSSVTTITSRSPWTDTLRPPRITRSTTAASLLTEFTSEIPSLGFPHRSHSSNSSLLTSSSGGAASHPSQSSSTRTREPFTPPPSNAPEGSPPTHNKSSSQHRHRSLSSSSFPPSDGIPYGSPPNLRSVMDAEGNIILRPGLNNTISQLSTLSHSNHTLSPYTRSLEHFTVRSVPHRASGSTPTADRQPLKAKRKRTYRLGSKKPPDLVIPPEELRTASSSPPPPCAFLRR
ncbi:hypothetical protein K439DRAFT_28031 [Ramaria rubella]|nr:hypothetical protein K439DRAFT_28031 [Ramaria rubella]